MFTFSIIVGVALKRPPKVDEYRKVVISANNQVEAEILACWIAGYNTVMPVSTELEWVEY